MVYPDRNDRKIKWIFSIEVAQDSELKLEEEEVEEVKWYTQAELTELYNNKDLGWTHSGYEQAVLSFLLDNR
jgi:isopentenyldiphosphate isomerase